MTSRQSGHRYATDSCYNNSNACARYPISSDAKCTYLLNAGAAFSVCPPVAPRPEPPLRVLSYPSTLEKPTAIPIDPPGQLHGVAALGGQP